MDGRKLIGFVFYIQVVAFLCVLGFVVLANDVDELQAKQSHYCAMVGLWKETDGNMGWPDYIGTYDTECTKATGK